MLSRFGVAAVGAIAFASLALSGCFAPSDPGSAGLAWRPTDDGSLELILPNCVPGREPSRIIYEPYSSGQEDSPSLAKDFDVAGDGLSSIESTSYWTIGVPFPASGDPIVVTVEEQNGVVTWVGIVERSEQPGSLRDSALISDGDPLISERVPSLDGLRDEICFGLENWVD